MREGPRRQPRSEPGGNFVAEDQRRQRLSARSFQPFRTRQRRGQDLHGPLARDVAMSLAQFDRPPRQSIEQGRRARVRRRPARRVDRRAPPTGRGQSRPHAGHLSLHRTSQDHAHRVEQHELGVLPNSLRDRLPRRAGNEVRQFLYCPTHHGLHSRRAAPCPSSKAGRARAKAALPAGARRRGSPLP